MNPIPIKSFELLLKVSAGFGLFCAMPTSLWAADATGYHKSTNNQCAVYNAELKTDQSVVWQGQCRDGYATGKGVAQWYDKDGNAYNHYQGTFEKGKIVGKGIIEWDAQVPNETKRYEGEFADGVILGKGVIEFTDGNRFEGDFVPCGERYRGKFTWGKDNEYYTDTYVGEYVAGKRSGYGVYTWGEQSPWYGDKYEGQWVDDQKEGKGKYTSKRTDFVYDGEWKDNKKHGYGVGEWSNGIRYEGYWANDNPSGKGKQIVPNKYVYTGDFDDGVINGKGKMVFPDGGWYEGDFANNEQTGIAKAQRANGIVYEGHVIRGKAWGFGQLTVPKAAFASDKRSKLGTWINDNTFFEQGWYVDNKLAFSCPSEQACRAQAATDPVKKAAITQTENHLAD